MIYTFSGKMFKVRWDSLSLAGWTSIPKSSWFSTVEGANKFTERLLGENKINVSIEVIS